jgi:diaminopropionate ammonia-lyase
VCHLANPRVAKALEPFPKDLPIQLSGHEDAKKTITGWPGYKPTQLLSSEKLASECDVGKLYLKLETERFGTTSFKVLGGAYAVHKLIDKLPSTLHGQSDLPVICAASAGNHAIGVACASKLANVQCHIYFPRAVSALNVQRAESFGAVVHQIDGSYEEAVAEAKRTIAAHCDKGERWQLVQDGSSWPDYQEIPQSIFEGYTVIGDEILNQLSNDSSEPLTHVFVNSGVGGLATSLCSFFWAKMGPNRPRFICVEPHKAHSLMTACEVDPQIPPHLGNEEMPLTNTLDFTSIQVGLDCKKGDAMAWRALRCGVDDFVTISDECVEHCMQKLRSYEGVEAGESAVAGIGVLLAAKGLPSLRQKLGLTAESRVGIVICEGPTQ